MKKIFIALVILVAFTALALFGLILEGNELIKFMVTIGATNILGAPVHIDCVNLNRVEHKLDVKGLKLYNPKGFPKRVLADIPEIHAEYSNDIFSHGTLHINTLRLRVDLLLVVKDKNGALNVDELRIIKDVMQVRMLVDTLILTADKVVYEDFTKGPKAAVQEFSVNIKEKTYKNITTAEELGRKVLSEIMAKTTIKTVAVVGAAVTAGVALAPPIGLPVAAAILMSGNDSIKADFDKSYEEVYSASLGVLERLGKISSADEKKGVIKGAVKGANIKISLKKVDGKIHVTVSGRRIIRPDAARAGGVLYEIHEELVKK